MSGSAGSTLTPEEIDAIQIPTSPGGIERGPSADGSNRADRYLPSLTPEEIDRLEPGEITPEQIDRLEPTYGRPVADLQQTTRGGPRRELPSAGEAFASFRQELPEGLPSVRSAGPAFAYAGNVARAVPADVAALAYPEAGGNIQEALTQPVGTKLPIDTAIDAAKAEEQDRPWYRKTSTLATISQGLARTAPKIAAIGATGAVATAAGAGKAATLLTQMFTAGGLFGLDEEGNFHPKEAAIGAALPGIGAATRLAVAKSIGTVLKNGDLFGSKSAAELLAQPVAQKVVETAGEQASLNAFTVAMDMPRLAQLYHDNPKEFQGELAELIGSNLAFGLLGVRKVTDSRIPSETQRWIVRNAEALSKKQVLQSIAPGTLAEIWNSDPNTASPEVNDIRRMIFENLDPATADQAFQKGVLVIGQEWPRLLAKAIGVTPQTVDVIPSATTITGGRQRALLPTTTGEANAIDTEQQQGGVQPERERIDAERQAAAEAGGGDRVPGATGQPPSVQTGGQGGGGQGTAGQGGAAGAPVPAPPAKPALTLKPDMATARAVLAMSPEQFEAAFPQGFNAVNIPLGQNVNDAELEELRKLAVRAAGRIKGAMLTAAKTRSTEDVNNVAILSTLPQFFNEAIAEAEKKRATGQPTASAGHTEPNPSPAQIEAGNAPKRTIKLHGLDISIENEKGGIRRSKPGAKEKWEVTMPAAYGYIKGTVGKDKDHIDAYVGDHPASDFAVVIDQQTLDLPRKFDEHKVMLGFETAPQALAAYAKAFADGRGMSRVKDLKRVSIDQLKDWLKNGDHKKPFADWLAKKPTEPAAPAAPVRKAGDLEGLTEAELDAMLDEAAKPTAKAVPAIPERPANIIALEKEVASGKGDEPYLMASGKSLGISKKQYLEMSGLSSYSQTEKYGYSIANLLEKLVTGTMPSPSKRPEPKRVPAAKRPKTATKEKTAKDIAADAAKAGVKGVDEAMQGLHKLFGGGKHLGAGPTFDEKTYQEAKPHFESAWEQFRKAGKSLADFLRFILDKFGVGVRAYIKRFIQEKQAGLQKTVQPPTVPPDVNRPTEGPSGGGGVGGAIPATAGATGPGGQAAAPPARPGGEVQPAGGPPDEGTAGAPGRPGGGAAVPDADRVPPGGTTGGQGTPERPAVGGGGEGAATVPGQPAAPASPVVSPPLGEPETTLPTETAPPQPKNLRLTENPAPTGAVARVNANIAAIELVKDLEKRGVFPTDAERATLAQWSGWGSFKELFNDRRADRRDQDPGWVKRYGKAYDKLKKLLTEAEFLAAIESSVNAHFSDPQVIKPMWTLTRRLGFKGGRVLESAVGRGDFIGFSPADLNLRWTMVELEPITARIAGYLYPEADLRIGGFEDAKLPRGYYDLNITNVPFFERGPGHEFPTMNLHNYFIARGLSMLKPGGLLLVITSKGTMDAEFDQRQILAGMGQLIGAVRLPSNAFKESAATEVVTDIIAIRKPDGKPFDQAQDWLNTVIIDVKGTPYNINEYYAKHPDMVLGRHAMSGTMYRGESYNVESTGGDIGPKLAAAIEKFPENVIQIERAAKPAAEEIAAGGMTSLEDYSLSLNAKGQVVEARNFQLERPSWDTGNDTLRKRAKQYVNLRDVLRQQYALERDKDATDAAIEANRKKLQAAYLAWTRANGTLNLNARKNDYLSSDPGYYTVLGLENVTQEADPQDPSKARTVIKPADVLSVRTLMPDRPPEKVDSAADALAVSLSYSGVLDLAYIKQLTGLTDEQIESDLIGANLAYKDPESGQLQTVADYLTGDVRDKLAKAMFAAKDNAAFERNVEALKSVIPDTVPFDRVSVDITARWTPVPVLNKFAVQELGLPENIVGFTPVIEEFSVRAIERISDRARTEWSTAKMAAPELLRHALNFKRALIREWDPVAEKYVKDEAGTALANQMIDAIKKRYAEWIRQTDHTTSYRFFDSKIGQYRTEEMPIWEVMEREFNRVANSFVVPENDGTKLTLPGLSTMVRRTQHLLNGVQRGINEGHAVFAHGVGSGKALSLDSKVLTPSGWKRMGDIRLGEDVIGQDGLPTKVIGVYPQGKKPLFEVRFSDGSKIKCCDEHLWLTQTYYERSKAGESIKRGKDWQCGKAEIRTTKQIRETLYAERGTLRTANHSIPMVEPVQFPAAQLPVHPYVLGVLLGDGCLVGKCPSFTTADPEVAERVSLLLPPHHRLSRHQYPGKCDSFSIVASPRGVNEVTRELVAMGVMHLRAKSSTKSVPDTYLFASAQQRLELLRGLMDTDGWNEKSKHATCFGTTATGLVEGLRFLVNSFGGTVSVCSKIPKYRYNGCHLDGQKSYTVSLRLPPGINPFYLTRKAAAFIPKSKYRPVRTVIEVSPCGEEEAQCIAVESPIKLYVCEDFIVTHNTFLGIVLGHELQRVGLSRKFIHVIKKPTVDQYRVSLQRAYPGSKVLIPTKKDFDRENRQKLLSRIASGRWDAVILTHEQFKSISPGEEMVNAFFNEQIQQLMQILREAGGSEADVEAKSTRNLDPSVRNIVRRIRSMRTRLDEHIASIRKRQDRIKWEDLNVDGVFIDESHAFKKMPLATNMENDVKGIPSDFSQRAVDLLVKVRDIQRRTSGRNVFFASGTPISNTLAELWVQFHATAPQMLKDLHVDTFDSFASTFADVVTSFELGWDGKTFKDVTRMSRFKNPSGLTTLTRLGMDVKIGNKELGLDVPDVEGGKPEVVVVKPTAAFMRCAALVERIADVWDTLDPKGRYDNSWVPIATMRMGVAAALDPRLVLPDAEDDPNSKVNTSIGHIFEEWVKGKEHRTTMMVFADLYRTMDTHMLMGFIGGEHIDTGDGGVDVEGQAAASNDEGDTGASDEAAMERSAIGRFNLYNDIRAKLVARGVPESEIAIITEHDTDAKRDDLFNKVRNGIVRILMGSTEKIGEGVDVPQRMSAQFHLDPPASMTPAKLEQRLGRIIRQGNLHSPKNWNLPVRIKMYAQERSMDAGIYQKLETKSVGVLQALRGQYLGDSFEDPADDITLTVGTLKAAATGDKRSLLLGELTRDVRELNVEHGAFMRRQSELRRAVSEEERASQTDQRNAADNTKLAQMVEGIVADKEKVSIYHSFTQKRVTGEEAIKEWLKAARAAIEEKCKEPQSNAEMHFLINDTLRLKFEARRNSKVVSIESTTEPGKMEIARVAADLEGNGTFYIGGTDPTWRDPRYDSTMTSIESVWPVLLGIPKRAAEKAAKELESGAKHEKLAGDYQKQIDGLRFDKMAELREKTAALDALQIELRGARAARQAARAAANPNGNANYQEWVKHGRPTDIDPQALAEYRAIDKPPTASGGEVALSVEPGQPLPENMPDLKAEGLAELKELLNDPRARLGGDVVRLAMAMLDQKVMRDLDWSRLRVELRNRIEGVGAVGTTNIGQSLIQLTRAASPTTFPHEVFHFLYEMLPSEDRDRVEEIRRQAIGAEVARWGGAMPSEVRDVLERLAQGAGISSTEFTRMLRSMKDEHPESAEWLLSVYHLINASEYLAGVGAGRFSKATFNRTTYSWIRKLWERIKGWLQGLLDSLRRLRNVPPDIEQLIRELLAGKYRNSPTGGEAADERRQFSVEPGDPDVPTKVFGQDDFVRGREQLTPSSSQEASDYAKDIFAKVGVPVVLLPAAPGARLGVWGIQPSGFDLNAEGRRLLQMLKKEIAAKNEPGKHGELLASLLNTIVWNFKAGRMDEFERPLREELYAVAQADRSQRGLQTGALAMHRSELDMVSQNIDVVLSRIWSDAYGGEDIRKLVTRVVEHFRDWFSDAEIEAALSSRPELREMVEKIIALNRRDEGGRVYRRVQQLLKPKMRKTLARLEGDARIEEAVEHILEQARRIGIEPKPNPNKKLPALQRLLLMVTPETAGKIDEAVAAAVQQAERNAGIKAALKAAGNDADREELQGRFDAGEEPEPEMVEEGLKLPEYAHWNWLRESILDYSPTTVKLAQDLIKQDFKGTRFGEQVQRPADTRIDLEKLAKQPDSAVRAGLDAYLANLEANMDLAGATDETKQRVQVLVETGVQEQLERARVRVRDPLFRERVVRQPQTLSPEERAIAAVEQLLNAGLFADPRLNLPEMISRVAEKSKLRRLAPTITDMIKDVFATPFYRQSELSAGFANEMISRLGVPPEQADAARAVFEQVFTPQYEKARARALEQAKASITPQERRVIKPGAALWVKIERMVNAGGFDGGQVLQEIARSKGWDIPTEQQVRHLRDLAEQEMRMRELTPQEQAVAGGDPRAIERALADRAAATLEKRAAIIKQMGTIWSRFSRPVNFRKPWATRKNIAAAANEFEVADMLLKVGFAFRLPTHILTQLLVHVPTRALGQAWINHQEELARGNPNSLIKEAALTLGSAMAGATKAIIPALNTAKAALAGRGEARNVDRLMSGIHLFERTEQRAQQYWDRGDYGRALFLRLMALPRFSLRFVQAVDNFQGVPAEYAQLRLQVRNALREQGRSPAEIDATIDRVLSGMKVKRDAAMGKAREILGPDAKEKEINEAAWHMVRSRIYEDLRDLGLETDDFKSRNEKLRRTVAWQERVMHGPGGIVASLGRGASTMLQEIGLPLSFVRFSNAIGTGINYMLMSTPAYALAGAKIPGISPNEPSPWFETEEDIMQRRAQALLGSVIGALIAGLVLSGALVVRLFWPKDKEERELWEAGGHRPGTIEIRVGPHEFIPISMTVGPGSIIAPYAAAAGAVVDMFGAREKAQLKLNQEAQKRGLTPGKVRQPDMSDWLTVAGTAAWGTLMGNKAFAGVGQSVSEFGIPNSKKTLSAYVSPLVPGLPAWQEMSRMMGVNLDSKLASFADYLVPLPTSGARAVNMLGEPVGTPDDVQRVFQSIFAGSYPWVVNEQAGVQKAPYAAMMASGYRPPSIDPGKGYAIAGQYRPLTDEELARYTVLRGENMAREFGSMGVGADQKSMQGAFQRANQAALEAVGVETPVSAGPTAGGYAATPRGVGAALSVAGGLGSPGRVSGQMRRVGARVRAGVRLPSPSRMAGAGRVRKAAAPRVRGAARPRATVGHHARSGVRMPSLRRRP